MLQNHWENWLIPLAFHAQPYPDGLIIKTIQTLDLDKNYCTIPLQTEEFLVVAIQITGDLGWPTDKGQLKFIVAVFIQEMDIKIPFKENMPGDKRPSLFKKHWHHCLSQRKLEYLVRPHAKGLNKEVLNGFFTMLENYLDTLGIKDLPKRFFNSDETCLSLDPKKK